MGAHDAGWLVVIDMQNVFAERDSPWCTPPFAAVAEKIAGLLPLFAPRTVFTRFVPPGDIAGSWSDYYRKWSFAAAPPEHELWALAGPWRNAPSVDSHKFSKWIPELQRITGKTAPIVLCGVSTDCCVLATALAAIDDGAFVRVVANACGAKTPEAHERALSLMRDRAPQLAIDTAEEERARHLSTAKSARRPA